MEPKSVFFSVYLWLLFSFLSVAAYAEGSKEITSNGGNRAYLLSTTVATASSPFPTLGTMKVYVKAGESIYAGSSAQGISTGTMNFRAPDGTSYTSGNDANIGLIKNRAQEAAGPLPNANGYTPFIIKVTAAQEGVWEVDFIPENNGATLTGNPPAVAANANWTQPIAQYITAFDVSVRNTANTQFINGRVFTNVFSGILGTFDVGFNGIFNILTKDGYQYTLNNNGQAGNGFGFFVNNKGFRNAAGLPSYQSVDGASANVNVQDPRAADTPTDITQKIFFNPPAADLPATANTPGGGTTWLLTAPVLPTVSNVTFTGTEGTPGKAGTGPLGGNFAFTTSGNGSYLIVIDVNQNGSYTDAIDRKITGTANSGINQVHWDGLDGLGNKVSAGGTTNFNVSVGITTVAGEVHFPFFDVERNVNGLLLSRINGIYAPDDTLYWDDTPITKVGTPSNPLKNLTGISSTINGHKWGTTTTDPNNDADFGNNKSIDTWGYIASKPVYSSVSLQLREADMAVDNVAVVANCAGQPIVYTVTVSNKGPGDVAGAKFSFGYPADITGLTVSSVSTSGTSSTNSEVFTAGNYTTGIDMANGAIRTFTISGKVALTASGGLGVTASVLRPADVTDPDATNPDAAAPTDAVNECNSPPSGTGCNNVIVNTTVIAAAPNAGPDQTIFQYLPATMAAIGTGTWAQLATDANQVTITNKLSNTTTITGLDYLGLYHFTYTNSNGCADSVTLKVIRADLEIPNIITPNNDGKNDVFRIRGLEAYPGTQLIIFNRWGSEVYRADDYRNNWDGSGLAEATYFYILNRRDRDGQITPLKGWVFLKRNK
ncbi:gliding motility-associated-like protein [Mucilaginibacter gracilis]|uniref:Gliding motility-associated-like protein n=1 Tax=Mucilaginibacter gracilis TaxID=423350 RepID=A0A495J729_9SPHI|nr:gliding motility-associated C-terminal domain-containing protein [Mucilaginibacter gracilis]RKR84531.1 gliding motility-associated-like protein [Mucilaginibacter gracilis]